MKVSVVASKASNFTGTMAVEVDWDGSEAFTLEEYVEAAAKAAILDHIVKTSDGWWMKKDEDRII